MLVGWLKKKSSSKLRPVSGFLPTNTLPQLQVTNVKFIKLTNLFFQTAFNEAGCSEEAKRVLVTLAMNAVALNKYEDASYYYWLLAKHHLQLACDT